MVDAFLNFVLSEQSQTTVVTKLAGFPGISLLSMGGTAKSEFGELGSASRESLPYSADISSDLNRIGRSRCPRPRFTLRRFLMAAPVVTGIADSDASQAQPSPVRRADGPGIQEPGRGRVPSRVLAGWVLARVRRDPGRLQPALDARTSRWPNTAIAQIGQNEVRSHGIASLGAITQVLEDRAFQRNVVATVEVFLVTSALVLGIAVTLTFWYRLRPSRPIAVLQFLSVIPLFVPVVIASFSCGPSGVREVSPTVSLSCSAGRTPSSSPASWRASCWPDLGQHSLCRAVDAGWGCLAR